MNSIKIIVCFSFFTIVSCQTEDNSKNKDVDRVPILKISDAEASKSSLKINCGCITDSLITENTTSCDTVILKSGGKLYYQFNCDSIWLTYENDKKHIIFNMTTELYAYTYRLGYQFSKEYDKYLLFRSGCPANGPCDFILINKETGKETKQLGELIYDHDSEVFHDFLIYFSDSNLNSLTLYFVDENRKRKIPINSKHFKAVVPEYQFGKVSFKNNVLELEYTYDKNFDKAEGKYSEETKKIKITI